MSQVYDIAIIGGGPVGMWAGFYAGFRGLKVLMIESTPELGGQVSFLYPDKEISDLPGIPSIKGRTLVDNLREQLMRFNPDIRT
ncbi:MAG: NAD(P)/FAD-dependent oxidoreductase, partial [Nitrososphaerota archaeon]|nr:NAD(P)/FAD-dependent oxidoreductase [Nitrososphaerota archaeon]